MSDGMIRVWDLPTRLFKWSLVICVTGALLTVNAGDMDMHAIFGFCAMSLVLFRIVWGIVGPETARFSRFVRPPAELLSYLQGRGWAGVGHNPLGGLSVLGMLGLVLLQASLGIFANDDILFDGPWAGVVGKEASDWLTGWHHRLSNGLWALIALHVAAVIWHSATGDDLIGPMLTGRRSSGLAQPAEVPLWHAIPALVFAVFVAGLAMRYWVT
ncbi:MAG: cytochrome b/b6 domain-containing protein [Pseudomonadota bacterium]